MGTFDKHYFSLRIQLKFTLPRECVHVKASVYFCRQNATVASLPGVERGYRVRVQESAQRLTEKVTDSGGENSRTSQDVETAGTVFVLSVDTLCS